MTTGLVSSVGVAAPPFTKGPYVWDQRLAFGASTDSSTAVQTSSVIKLFESYLNYTGTSGDVRTTYTKLFLSGAGGTGESLRAYTFVNNVAAGSSAHGAHIGLDFDTSGSVTGLGVAVRATFSIANAAMSAGTYAAIMAELWSNGSSSDLAGVTEQSFIRFVASGNGTGIAKVDSTGNLFSIQGLTVGSGKLFQANTAAAATHALRIVIGSTLYYIMLTNQGA